MLGMGWSEILVVGVVALIVVGPKDLPNMFRAIGQFTGKAKGMAREFSRAMEAAADESGVKDIAKTIKAAGNPAQFGADKLRSATGLPSSYKPGSATETLSKERAEAKAKISDATARAATERKAREAATQSAPPPDGADSRDDATTIATPDAATPETRAPATSKPAASKPAVSKSAASKPAASKPTASKPKVTKSDAAGPAAKSKAAKPTAARPRAAATSKAAARPRARKASSSEAPE